MPRTPKGHKRPADVIGNAGRVMKIATGEEVDTPENGDKDKAAVELGRRGGLARAKALSAKRRKEIAMKAAKAKYNK